METRYHFDRLIVERLIIERIRKSTHQPAPHQTSDDGKRLWVLSDEFGECVNGRFKPNASPDSFCLVPGAGAPDILPRCEPVNDSHPSLIRRKEPGLHFIPGQMLRVRVGQPPTELLFVPLGDGNLTRVRGDTVPDLFQQLKPLVDGKSEDLFKKRLRSHAFNVNEFRRPRKRVV